MVRLQQATLELYCRPRGCTWAVGPVERKLSASEGEGTVAAPVSAHPQYPSADVRSNRSGQLQPGWLPLAWL